jgi:hypothetical protein
MKEFAQRPIPPLPKKTKKSHFHRIFRRPLALNPRRTPAIPD